MLKSLSNSADQAGRHPKSITNACVCLSSESGRCKGSDCESMDLNLESVFLNHALKREELTRAVITIGICSDY